MTETMLRTIFLALFLATGMARAIACGPFDRLYSQDEHTTFRIFAATDIAMGGDRYSQNRKFQKDNLRLWQELTSPQIPLADIDSVVYSWDMNRLARLVKCASGDKTGERERQTLGKNALAKWIVDRKDTELAQYLLLAKDCERVMDSQNSLWYYYVEGDEQSTRLAETARRDAADYKGKRLADRYALLRIRALFASKHYEECIKVWETQKSLFRPDAIRDKAEGYVAGACAKTGEKDRAIDIYTRVHDYESLISLSDAKTSFERFALCVRLWPNDQYTLSLLQQRVNDVERGKWRWWQEADASKDYTELLGIVEQVLRRSDSRNSAEWNYAAAFIEEQLGRRQSALRHLKKAQRCSPAADLRDALRVMEIYMRVKYSRTYDDKLEKWLLGELTWMAGKAKDNLTPERRGQLARNVLWDVKAGRDVYYWDDMMRKVVLGQVVPLCVKSRYKVRALQYANMGENHLFCLLGGDRLARVQSMVYGMDAGDAPETQNFFDYENDYFLNLDSLGVRTVERLIYRMRHPECPTDSFLAKYGYTDMLYLYDIAGTQMIASMRYREAEKYLSKVPAGFQATRNYSPSWSTRDPFDPKRRKRQKRDLLYKLHFAQRMAALEDKMRGAKNPNDRAEATLKYVAGLENSVTRCWPLTSYYYGYWDFYPMYSRNYTRRVDNIVGRSRSLKREAFKMFTDKERAARACCEFSLYKTAARLYPDTESGKLVRGKCDVLKDYTALSGINYRKEWHW